MFPYLKHKHDILTKALLPEALKRIAHEKLQLNSEDVQWYMEKGALGVWVDELKKKDMKGKGKKRKTELTKDCKKFQKTKDNESDVVFVSTQKVREQKKMKEMQRPDFGKTLYSDDREVLLVNGVIDDRHVMIVQNLLHQEFPLIEGLYSTTLGTVGLFQPVKSEFVQILHDGDFHWVCVSNIGCSNSNTVKLYDSLFARVSKHTQEQISNLLHCHAAESVRIEVQAVQQQTNGVDCGVFGLAFATALCFGKNPCDILLNRRKMREHLWWCIESGTVAMFPYSRRQ